MNNICFVLSERYSDKSKAQNRVPKKKRPNEYIMHRVLTVFRGTFSSHYSMHWYDLILSLELISDLQYRFLIPNNHTTNNTIKIQAGPDIVKMCLWTIHTWVMCDHEITEWHPCKKVLNAQRRSRRWSKWFCISAGASSRPVCQVTIERVGNQSSCPDCIARMNKSLDVLKHYEEEKRWKVVARQQQMEQALQAEEQHAAGRQQRKEMAAKAAGMQQEAEKARERAQVRNAALQRGRARARVDSYIEEDLYRQCFEALLAAEYAANVPAPLRTKYTNLGDDRVQEQGRSKPTLPPLKIPAPLPCSKPKGKISPGRSNLHRYGKPGPFMESDSPTIPALPVSAPQAARRAPVSRGAIVRNSGNSQVQRQPEYPYVAPPHSVQYRPLPLRAVEVKERPGHEIARDFGSHIPNNRKIVHETSDEYGEPLPGDDFLDGMTRYGWI
jgi:hypothetical protein